MRKILSLIIVMRPHNVAAAVLSVAVGFAMTGSTRWPWLVLAAAAFATAAGNTINDIYDVDIDRVAVSVFLMLFLPGNAALWIGVWIVLLHIYSWRLKRMYLAGNILVSAVAGSGFLLGAHVGGDIAAGAIPAAFTFFFVMGREIVKDTDDITGDTACRAATFPIVSGKRAALTTALAIFLALCISIPAPTFMGIYGRPYALVMLLSVVPILLISIWIIVTGRALGTVSTLLKIGMFFGCAAFYVGSRT
jgi:geranylgeranylglycerol-phosphate geranylgeranyltransferase